MRRSMVLGLLVAVGALGCVARFPPAEFAKPGDSTSAALLQQMGVAGTPYALYLADRAAAVCSAMQSCSHGAAKGHAAKYGSEALCTRFYLAKDLKYAKIGLVQSGQWQFDPAQGEACAAAWRKVGCNLFPPAACNDVVKASNPVANGAWCGHDRDCASGACDDQSSPCESDDTCVPPDELCGGPCPYGSLCMGTCVPLFSGQAGAACVADYSCATGLFCPLSSWSCTPQHDLGDVCEEYDSCKAGLFCEKGKCATQGKAGDACDSGASPISCEDGLFCLPGAAASEVCMALGKQGTPCDGVSVCAAGLRCPSSGAPRSCQPVPDRSAACDPAESKTACLPPFVCAADTKLCVPPPGEGQTCLTGLKGQSFCDFRTQCDPDGICRLGPGEPCTAGAKTCSSGYDCTSGRCVMACSR